MIQSAFLIGTGGCNLFGVLNGFIKSHHDDICFFVEARGFEPPNYKCSPWLSTRATITTAPGPTPGVYNQFHYTSKKGCVVRFELTISGSTIRRIGPTMLYTPSVMFAGHPSYLQAAHARLVGRADICGRPGIRTPIIRFRQTLCSRVGSNHRPSPRQGDVLPLNYRNI